jgi:hypothetical protein
LALGALALNQGAFRYPGRKGKKSSRQEGTGWALQIKRYKYTCGIIHLWRNKKMDKNRKVKLVVEMSEQERRKVKAKLAKEGKTVQEMLYHYIRLYLKTKG